MAETTKPSAENGPPPRPRERRWARKDVDRVVAVAAEPGSRPRSLPTDERLAIVPDWSERSQKRWRVAVALFDDTATHATTVGDRWESFESTFRAT